MRISGYGEETYLYLNGIGISKKLILGENIELLPANCSPNPDDIISVSKNEVDIGISAIFLRQVRSQFHIMADDPKSLAMYAWNSLWDALLLGALFDCEAVCNFQCDKPAEEFNAVCELEITNYHLRGLTDSVYMINDQDHAWIEQFFQKGKKLLNKPKFQNAVHCLATYRWHSLPRAKIALIWSGIEGMVDVGTETVFRLSLYISRFLSPTNKDDMKIIFSNVKKLYTKRSSAVHGSKIKGEVDIIVKDSAELLRTLIRQCIIIGDLPRIDELAP